MHPCIRSLFLPLLCGCIALALTACAANSPPKSPPSGAAGAAGAASPAPAVDYPLAYGDGLQIRVWRHEDLTLETKVNGMGMVSMPLIGDIKATGLTSAQLRDELTRRYKTYLVDPQILVTVTQPRGRVALLFGEVEKEGDVTLDHDVSLFEAVARAGGFTRDANPDRVLLVRGALGTGAVQAIPVNMSAKAAQLGGTGFNGYLAPGDIVFVPSTTLADVERFMNRIRNILETFISLERMIIFMPQVRDAVSNMIHGRAPDTGAQTGSVQTGGSQGASNVGGENLSNQGGAIPAVRIP